MNSNLMTYCFETKNKNTLNKKLLLKADRLHADVTWTESLKTKRHYSTHDRSQGQSKYDTKVNVSIATEGGGMTPNWTFSRQNEIGYRFRSTPRAAPYQLVISLQINMFLLSSQTIIFHTLGHIK